MKLIRIKYSKQPPEFNMQKDYDMFRNSIKTGNSYFRAYNWSEPAVTLGYFQKKFAPYTNIDIPVIKRHTGGKAVLHYNDYTFSVVMNLKNKSINIKKVYSLINEQLNKTFIEFGIKSDLVSQKTNNLNLSNQLCFSYKYDFEVQYKGVKIVGIAQKREKDCVLIQGNIPITINKQLYKKIFNITDFTKLSYIKKIQPEFDIHKFDDLFYSNLEKLQIV